MKSLVWKLAIVAAVVGVGSLVMLQAQRAMNRSMLSKSNEAPGTESKSAAGSTAETVAQTDSPADAGTKSAPTDTVRDPSQQPAQTTSPNKSEPSASTNPFADPSDSPPAKDPLKSAAASPPGAKEASVKQAGANADENPMNAIPPGNSHATTPGTNGPQASPAPSAAEPVIPQSEPNTDAKSGADGKDGADGKNGAGPQLSGPGASSESASPAPAQPESKAGATDASSGPAMPTAEDDKQPSKNSGPALGGQEPPSFPDLDKHEKSPFPAAGDKTPSKTAANTETGPSDRPNLFPADSGKEVPLTNSSAPKSAGAPAPSAAPAGARDNTNLRSDPAPELQGDGTVSEAAPLGPQRPQLNIEKIAPQNALLGQPLIYSIVVKNSGNSEAHEVVVEDRIPKGTKLSGTIPRAEMSGKKLSWRIGNLAPGQQRKISIRVIPLEAGEIGSVATVNFVAEAAAETIVTAPRLEFELSAPRAVKLGEMIPFHFRVKNVGTGEARGVVIRDVIPESLSHSAGNDLEYEVGRLPPGRSKELTLDLKAIKVGATVNRAVAIGDGGISVEAKAEIEVRGSKVALTRTGPPRRYLLRPAVYANTLVNESKYDVEGVVVVESVPPGMDFVRASHNAQYNDNTRTIAWRIDRMAAGETCVLKTQLVPKTAGNQTSMVRVTVPNGEPVEATTTTLAEGFAALALEVPSIDSPIDVGEKVTFRVNARNKGTIPATNVVVTVEVPDQMVIKSARGPGKHEQEGNRIRFGPIPTLEGRTAATCELVLESRKRGDSRIKVTLQADQIEKPLAREESVLVLSESSEPAAAH